MSVGPQPSASYSVTIRVQLPHSAGSFAKVAGAIGDTGAILGAIDLVRVDDGRVVRDVTVACADVAHGEARRGRRSAGSTASRSRASRTAPSCCTSGGKIEVEPKVPIKTRDDLSMAYTPGVARVCDGHPRRPRKAWTLTIKGNTVAVVTDGTAVLGLGDIGPAAAMPVMEGKAMLFKEFAGVDAFPICLDTKDVDEIVAIVKAIAPGFGGINLEDISAPRCFEIEHRLRAELDIPVFHDDQHGTAVVVLAALRQRAARRRQERRRHQGRDRRAPARPASPAREIILAHGVQNLVVCDVEGALYAGRPGLDPERAALAARTNPNGERGMADEVAARRRRVHRRVGPGRRVGRGGAQHGPRPDRLRAWPTPSPRSSPRRSARTSRSWPRGARTTPTRSTTCSPSPASSAARSTSAPARSTRR